MSEENLEIVRRIYREGLIDRDPKRLVDYFATPDIEYVEPSDDVDPGSRRGRGEVLLALRRARQSFARTGTNFTNCSTRRYRRRRRHLPRSPGSKREDIEGRRRTSGHSAKARSFASKKVAI